jgi:predicted GNAT family acetyltransferase
VARTPASRVLGAQDLEEVRALLARNPVEDVFIGSRVESCGLDPWRLGAEIWGFGERGELTSLCYAGANLVPAQAGAEAVHAFAERARRQGRRCSSIVGSSQAALGLWTLLEPMWGPAREVRPSQPLMAIDDAPDVEADPQVRRVLPHEIDVLLPACVAMFTEEVGVSPLAGDGGSLYRARVEEIIALGRAFARIEGGAVLFKAEIGAATRDVCQVQGVWVHPSLRGRGVGATGTAAVVEQAQASIAPVVSLYVNDYNVAARRAYERVGIRQVGTFASVLF